MFRSVLVRRPPEHPTDREVPVQCRGQSIAGGHRDGFDGRVLIVDTGEVDVQSAVFLPIALGPGCPRCPGPGHRSGRASTSER